MQNWPKIPAKKLIKATKPKHDKQAIWVRIRGFEFMAENYLELTGDTGPSEAVTWENQRRCINIYVQALAARKANGDLIYVPQSTLQPQFGHCDTQDDVDEYIARNPEAHSVLIFEVQDGMALPVKSNLQ